jgi:hypothetical protein
MLIYWQRKTYVDRAGMGPVSDLYFDWDLYYDDFPGQKMIAPLGGGYHRI